MSTKDSDSTNLYQSARKTYIRLLTHVKPYRAMFLFSLFGTALASILDGSISYMIKPILDKGFVAKDPEFLSMLVYGIPIVFALRAVANFTSRYCMERVGQSLVFDLRKDMFAHLIKLPAEYFDRQSSGNIISKITYNTSQVANACTDAMVTVVQYSVLVIVLLSVMFIISWRLSLIFFVVGPLMGIIIRYTSRRLRKLNHKIQNTMGNITHVTEEAVEGFKLIKLFGAQDFERARFNKAVQTNRNMELKIIVAKTMNVSATQMIGAFAFTGMIYMATGLSTHHGLSAGGVAAILAAMIGLLRPLKLLANVNSKIQRGIAGAQSIFELLDRPIESDTGTYACRRAKGAIGIEGVNFCYTPDDALVLKDVNLAIEPGQMIALVGRSGSGKTTLVSLLARFYELPVGRITLDDIELRDWTLASLRDQFAFVSQHVVLFNDTIANNIAYGDRDVTREAIVNAARAAHALEFIDKLPDGLDSMVGDNGVLLSGGQRQRLAIARAILKNAPILILDEATSALDTESERLIQSAMTEVMRDRTTIVIAHRLSTIEQADKIVVMDEGRIVETGSHAELLARDGHYSTLHRVQYGANTLASANVEDAVLS